MPTWEAVRLGAGRRWRAFARFCEPITSLHGFAGLRIVAQTASTSLPEAKGVLVLLVWFCAIFMLSGLQRFAGKTGLRCALCEDDACTLAQLGSAVAPELPCGFAADARRCDAPLACLPARDNPLSAWTSFDDFRWASLSVLRVALAGGWWEVLAVLAAGAGRGAAVAFCVPLVVGTGHLLVPLFASMQSDMFGEAWRAYSKGAEKEYAAFKVTMQRTFAGLGVWFCVALRLQHPEEHARHSREAPKAAEPPRLGTFRRLLELALLSPQLPLVLAVWHALNIIVMTIASANLDETVRTGCRYVNLILTVTFALKTAAQVAVLEPAAFMASWTRVLEAIVTLVSLIVLLPQTGARYGVSVLRCFCVFAAVLGPEPPMWLQRRLRRDAGLRRLQMALSHSVLNAKELFLFAGVYVLAWAVLGLVVFGGSASESPASATSFSSILSALYTSFALLTGANCWHRAMWHQMEAVGTPAVLFGLVQQLGAVFVMATLKGAFVRSFAVKEDTERTHVSLLDDAAEMHEADIAVSTVAASLEERIKTMKRHRAAVEVHSMRAWLKREGRIHDYSGYDSADEGDAVPGDTRRAKAERRKARREAHEDWVAPKVFAAPDGTQVVDDGCDGFLPQDSELRNPESGWRPQGLALIADGLDVPVLLEDAHDRRRTFVGLLKGRQQLLRERHREVRKAELIASGRSSGSEHGSSGDDRSDDEAPPTVNAMVAAARRPVPVPALSVPVAGEAGGIQQPAWLTGKPAVVQPAVTPVFKPPGSNAQRRARSMVQHAQSLTSSRPPVPIALAGTAAVALLCEDEELWAPCGDDLPLPMLQPSNPKRTVVKTGAQGTPRACLVIDTEELPVPYTRDLPDRPLMPLITGAVSCEYMHHDSLWLFLPNSLARRFLFIVTMHPYYRVACAICTVIACAVYAAEPAGNDPRNSRAASMSYVDMLLNLCFGYELGIKLVVRGGILHPGSVLRTLPGWFEFAAFAGGLAGTLGPPRELRALRCLRLFSVLPLLRSLEVARPLAILLTVLERAAPTLRRLFLLGAAALYVYAVASTQILGGQGTRCADPLSPADVALCSGLFVDSSRGGARLRTPLTPVLHFEDVANAALSLFAVLTLDEWPAVARPFVERDFAAALLFVVWIALAVMLWLNLVFGAVVDAYLRVSLLLSGRRLGDETAHRDWAAAFRLRRQQVERAERLAAEGMSAATSAARRAATELIEQPWFEPLMCFAIGVNILLVAVEDAVPAGPTRDELSRGAEIAFAVIFSLELAIQMTAVGVLSFLRNSRNRVDLVVTLSSVLVLISGSTSFNVNVLRLLRLERVIRLFPNTRRLQLLLQTLFTALPGLAALTVIVLLMLVVYSIIGMALFGLHDPVLHPTAAASPATAVNFSTFGQAMLTMFKLFTLDGWSGAMQQLLRCDGVIYLYEGTAPFAERCYFTPAPPLFLISFTICCTFMASSLAMAVVFDAYRISLDDFGVTSDVGDTLRRVSVLNRIAERFMRPVQRSRAIYLGIDEETLMRRRLLLRK